jgi:hypothetical protein
MIVDSGSNAAVSECEPAVRSTAMSDSSKGSGDLARAKVGAEYLPPFLGLGR